MWQPIVERLIQKCGNYENSRHIDYQLYLRDLHTELEESKDLNKRLIDRIASLQDSLWFYIKSKESLEKTNKKLEKELRRLRTQHKQNRKRTKLLIRKTNRMANAIYYCSKLPRFAAIKKEEIVQKIQKL